MEEFRNVLENSFEELGVTYDDTVIQKCVDICKKHDITDAEEFVDSWMAYSVSHFKGDNPTITYLNKFEREEYGKKSKETSSSVEDDHKRSLIIYEANKMEFDSEPATNILRAYNETTPRSKHYSDKTTPDNNSQRGRNGSQATFSPASFSPSIATPSSKYATRTNAGEVVFKFNENEPIRDWKTKDDYAATVDRYVKNDIQRYMCFDLLDCVDWADENIEKLGALIAKKNSLDDFNPVRQKHPLPFVTVGRIACDADGRLNSKSVMLEGSRNLSSGEAVQLDLSGVPKYSIFPGQIVAVEGFNTTGEKLVAQQIFHDASPESSPPAKLSKRALNVMIASGPYTQSDSMTYQPLLDLIEKAAADEPHALILTGPFIDTNHPFITENTIAETYQDLFRKLVDQIMKPLEGKRTEVFLVASYKDCHGHCVYPTPQLPLSGKTYPKLHLLPDPSIITVEDVVIGVTSTDILMHLGKEEISCPPNSADRLSRLAGHVIAQQHFYPLFPAIEVPLDPTLIGFAKLPVVPHVLILPSDLRYFIKEVSGCVTVNPERLAKGIIGGAYARLFITQDTTVGHIIKI